MTVTKSRNLIANRNTGGNKKQGLAPSIGKSSGIRQSQLVRASSNDKTVYCINQVGGIGRFRNQLSSADSTGCASKVYTINNALKDSLDILKLKYDYLFAYIVIYNKKFNATQVYINISNKSPHTFNHINFTINNNNSPNTDSDISFNNVSLKKNNTSFLYQFSNNDYNFTSGNLNIFNISSQNYDDISDNDVSLNSYGFLNHDSNYNVNYSDGYDALDIYGYDVKYYIFSYGSLYEYSHEAPQMYRLDNNYFVTLYVHKNT